MLLKKIKIKIYEILLKLLNYINDFNDREIEKKNGYHSSIVLNGCQIIGNVHIDKFTYANNGSVFSSGENSKVVIGKYCAIGRYVHITSKGHSLVVPTADESHHTHKHIEKDTFIGDYVWIGDHVFVKHGIKIENYSIIGANSVVTQDVKAFEIVGGVPAKHIRFNSEHYKYDSLNKQ